MTDITKTIDKQRQFFNEGTTLPLSFRRKQLRKLYKSIEANEEQIMKALHKDLRKSQFESYITEIGYVKSELRETISKLRKWASPEKVQGIVLAYPSSSYIQKEPLGVVLIISPWNYPFQLTIAPLIAALAAGNCAIIKPSEYSSNTAQLLEDILTETFDGQYVQVIQGDAEVSTDLLKHRYDKIFFTGSTKVGKSIMKAAAEHLTPVTLELGGKSPCIVTESADIPLAAKRIVWGKFVNAGQTCIAPDYILIDPKIKDEFISACIATIEEFYGKSPQSSPDFPRIINDSNFERLQALLTNGTTKHGGEANGAERYIAPTILDDITWDDDIMQEEIFGPILPILTYNHIEEVINTLKKREKPLALYVFSADNKVIDNILTNCHFGGGCVNDCLYHLTSPYLPFGGVGQSGMGAYHGKFGFDSFSHKKSVMHRKTWLDVPLRYPPYKGKLESVRKAFNWL